MTVDLLRVVGCDARRRIPAKTMDKEPFVCNDYLRQPPHAALAGSYGRHLQPTTSRPMAGGISVDKLFLINTFATRHNVASRRVARVCRG